MILNTGTLWSTGPLGLSPILMPLAVGSRRLIAKPASPSPYSYRAGIRLAIAAPTTATRLSVNCCAYSRNTRSSSSGRSNRGECPLRVLRVATGHSLLFQNGARTKLTGRLKALLRSTASIRSTSESTDYSRSRPLSSAVVRRRIISNLLTRAARSGQRDIGPSASDCRCFRWCGTRGQARLMANGLLDSG